MDVPELALAVEYLLRPLARDTQALGEGPEQLDDLRDMIVIFAVFGARLWVEEIVSGDEFEDLRGRVSGDRDRGGRFLRLTMHAILHTSVLAPHFAPKMTSGERYCLVWMSLVK
jgi:hypothetical protein